MLPTSAPVVVEDYFWIGSRVFILRGVRIGHHALIGACSVVTKGIPPQCITVVNSARIIGSVAHPGRDQARHPHSYCTH
jgi:acetyltransferase-like isoleucine patch superfamily enzyme